MNFELTEEQRMIQEMARSFAEKEVAPVAAELDETHRFPTDLAKKMGELGLMGVAVPEEYNGAGMDYVTYSLVVEEINIVRGLERSISRSRAVGYLAGLLVQVYQVSELEQRIEQLERAAGID